MPSVVPRICRYLNWVVRPKGKTSYGRCFAWPPSHLSANSLIVGVLDLSGRRQEAIPHILQLMQRDRFNVDQLVLLGAIGGVNYDADLMKKWEQVSPDDLVLLQGLAWQEMSRDNLVAAEQHLRRAVNMDLGLPEAQIRLGSILLDFGSAAKFQEWYALAPRKIYEDPQSWGLRGSWAQRQGESRIAARCFWEAVKRDPNYSLGNYQLGQILSVMDLAASARLFLDRAGQLEKLRFMETRLLNAEQEGLDPLREIADQMESMGRVGEAWGRRGDGPGSRQRSMRGKSGHESEVPVSGKRCRRIYH